MIRGTRSAAEPAIAGALYAFAVAAFAAREWHRPGAAPAILLFAVLTAPVLSLSIGAWRTRLRNIETNEIARFFLVPVLITAAIAIYSAAVSLPIGIRVATFGAYLLVPAGIVFVGRTSAPAPWQVLAAAACLWLPIEFGILPPVPLPPPRGFHAANLAALANGLHLFLVAAPLDGIGYTFRLRAREFGLAVAATVAFALVAVPIGLATGFLHWGPRVSVATTVITPVAIYLATGVPEEFLFRGLIQNALEHAIGRAGLPVAAIVFGFAHLPDPRYVLLAAFAGVAYGWVYTRTRRITASAITHALVDWIWVLLLRG